jgi:methyl-accepting chemotaxis protein
MFKNAKIGVKISIGYAIFILTIIIITAITLDLLNVIDNEAEIFLNVQFHNLNNFNEFYDSIVNISAAYREIDDYQTTNPSQIPKTRNQISVFQGDIEKIKKDVLQTEADIVNSDIWTDLLAKQKAFNDYTKQIDRSLDRNPNNSISYLLQAEYNDSETEYLDAANEFLVSYIDKMSEFGVLMREEANKLEKLLVIVVVVGLILAMFLTVKIVKSITKPIADCVEIAEELAKGHTDFQIFIDSTDETGVLKQSMLRMLKSIRHLDDDILQLSEATIAGNIRMRISDQKLLGDYIKIIEGLNETLDAVVNPIQEVMEVMERLANRDLTARVLGDYKGEIGEFKDDVNKAAINLNDALKQVDTNVSQINGSAEEINEDSHELAESTAKQASSLKQISTSLEEINSLTKNNADNAKSCLNLADEAVHAVDAGNDLMEKMTQAMATILKSSQETGAIIKTIDDIAFQTNLLALNAAVEAAHAGDAGKGFAVVAEEVKNLALRSAEAARNTNALIEESAKNSEIGSNIVKEVTNSFALMKSQFAKVKSIISEISAASDEQASSVNQISNSVQDMNQMSQQSATNAQESATVSEQLSDKATELKNMVETFTITT